jgi:polysaccharide export outer membrane protein
MRRLFVNSLISISLMVSSSIVAAQTLSPAMIEQFKSLPKTEQEALAKQYGVDLSVINKGSDAVDSSLAAPANALPQVEKPVSIQVREQGDVKNPLKRFGIDIFDSKVSTFAPTDNAQVPAEYRLGVGDELVIQLYGKENSVLNLQVNRDGVVNFPKLGPVSVAGLTFEDAQSLLQAKVSQQFIGVDSTVTMGRLRAMSIFMAGEVNVPGTYSVSALTTITQALFQAGGITDIGSLRDIQVKRAGKLVATFDVYDLLLNGDISGDVRLQSGDVVFVPPYSALVTMMGEVKRPGVYEVANNETVNQVIDMAGGYKSSAFAGELVLIKKRNPGELPVAINIRAGNQKQLQTVLANGDVIRVLPLGDNVENLITLEGALARPGVYGWKEGLRVSGLISDFRRDLLPDADLTYSLIIREKNEKLDVEVIQLSLVDALANKGGESDPILKPRDKVLVFEWEGVTKINEQLAGTDLEARKHSRKSLLAPVIEKLQAQADSETPALLVTIGGAVKSPGTYPLATNYSINDLISAAGGTDDSAYTGSYEVRRLVKNSADENEILLKNVDRNETSNFILQSRDHVSVKTSIDWNPNSEILLQGEVKYPGKYLLRRDETLADIILRAGGLTPQANAMGAIFTRESIAQLETAQARQFGEQLRREFAASLMTQETQETDYTNINAIVQDLEKFSGFGRLVIDLDAALLGDPASNILLEDGDVLRIPRQTNTVTVIGEVRRQGSHTFEPGLSLQDYLGLAAGTTVRSDEDNIYIVKASGRVVRQDISWTRFANADLSLQPGDTVVVPINTTYKDFVPFWRDITAILYQGTVAIAAVARL